MSSIPVGSLPEKCQCLYPPDLFEKHISLTHECQWEALYLSSSSLRLSMPRGDRLSDRVFLLISLPVSRFPRLCSACLIHITRTAPPSASTKLKELQTHQNFPESDQPVSPWRESHQNWPPCWTGPSSSWPHRPLSSSPPRPLFFGAPPDRKMKNRTV